MKVQPVGFENKTNQCPTCDKPLMWKGHVQRSSEHGEIYEFFFSCEKCGRQFVFRDGSLFEQKPSRDVAAEANAIHKLERTNALSRRCPQCGGPLDEWLTCGWCHERYSVDNGELVPIIEELLKHKTQLSDFYALQRKQ
jgi:uncharacterized protein with PIN domain